jgi:antitoxin component of RelBE/YafQ-DinJ toxin-antitoxin module
MDAIITARIPIEIKEQGNAILSEIGATPTLLINAAYKYVLDNKKLPGKNTESLHQSRKLSAQQEKDLLLSLESTTFPVSDEYWNNKSYKQLIEEGKQSDYEALP